jgi:predicted dehydrogenase
MIFRRYSLYPLLKRIIKNFIPPKIIKKEKTIKIGILGAANIAYMGIINPTSHFDNVEIYGIASRDTKKAMDFAIKYSIKRVYNDYKELIDDENIDIIYNPLPNSLHYHWTIEAIKKKKHVF